MAEYPIPDDERAISDVETLKVLADARRLAILRLMQKPTTVKALADELAIAPSKLYYHVNMLVEHDLLRVVDHNLDNGIVEKVYQVTARRFRLQNPLLAGDSLPRDTAGALLVSLLTDATDSFRRSYAAGLHDDRQPPRFPFVTYKEVRLTPERLTLLHAKLVALVEEVTHLYGTTAAPDAESYEFALAFFRSPDESHSSEAKNERT